MNTSAFYIVSMILVFFACTAVCSGEIKRDSKEKVIGLLELANEENHAFTFIGKYKKNAQQSSGFEIEKVIRGNVGKFVDLSHISYPRSEEEAVAYNKIPYILNIGQRYIVSLRYTTAANDPCRTATPKNIIFIEPVEEDQVESTIKWQLNGKSKLEFKSTNKWIFPSSFYEMSKNDFDTFVHELNDLYKVEGLSLEKIISTFGKPHEYIGKFQEEPNTRIAYLFYSNDIITSEEKNDVAILSIPKIVFTLSRGKVIDVSVDRRIEKIMKPREIILEE